MGGGRCWGGVSIGVNGGGGGGPMGIWGRYGGQFGFGVPVGVKGGGPIGKWGWGILWGHGDPKGL